MAELSLKVAFICACYDHRVLKAKDLTPALEFAKYQMRLREILSPSPAERDEAKIQFRVRRYMNGVPDSKWVTRSMLFKKSHAERYGISAFEKAMTGLVKTYELQRAKHGNKQVYRRAL